MADFHVNCEFILHEDGTADLRWDQHDIENGASAQLKAYVTASLLFAAHLGGIPHAYKFLKHGLQEFRQGVQAAGLQFATRPTRIPPTNPEPTTPLVPPTSEAKSSAPDVPSVVVAA